MAICYVCKKSITSNNTSMEHIIPNAIGGRLKSAALLCKQCNNALGTAVDNELTSQLNTFSNLLMIKRDRTSPPNLMGKHVVTGEEILIKSDGTFENVRTKVTLDDEEKKLLINARSRKEAKKTLIGLKKTYPEIDVEESLKNIEYQTDHIDHLFSFRLQTTENMYRSICKTAINYYIFHGGDINNITSLLPYVCGQNVTPCVSPYYSPNIVKKDYYDVLHSILLVADTSEGILYSYIEYFNFYSFVILLNDEYKGDSFISMYSYDVLKNEKVKKQINLSLTRSKLSDLLINPDHNRNQEYQVNEIKTLMQISNKRRSDLNNVDA